MNFNLPWCLKDNRYAYEYYCCSFQGSHRNVNGTKIDESKDYSKIEQMSVLSGILMTKQLLKKGKEPFLNNCFFGAPLLP